MGKLQLKAAIEWRRRSCRPLTVSQTRPRNWLLSLSWCTVSPLVQDLFRWNIRRRFILKLCCLARKSHASFDLGVKNYPQETFFDRYIHSIYKLWRGEMHSTQYFIRNKIAVKPKVEFIYIIKNYRETERNYVSRYDWIETQFKRLYLCFLSHPI